MAGGTSPAGAGGTLPAVADEGLRGNVLQILRIMRPFNLGERVRRFRRKQSEGEHLEPDTAARDAK